MERQLVVDFFADQGLTEESIFRKYEHKNLFKSCKRLVSEKAKMNQIQKMHQKKWERQKNNNITRNFIKH